MNRFTEFWRGTRHCWQRFARWHGWKGLLFPPGWLVWLISLLSGAGLLWVFLSQREDTLFAYFLYPVCAYALLTLILWLIKKAPNIRRNKAMLWLNKGKTHKKPIVTLYFEHFVNFFYGIYMIAMGTLVGSAWIATDGVHNFLLGLIQLYQILQRKKADTLLQKWKSYRRCGFLIMLLHLSMVAMIFQMVNMGRHKSQTAIGIISTAVFTFYKLIKAMFVTAKDRKHKDPVESSVFFLQLAQALYNLFVLQVGLLWVFGGPDYPYLKLMNTLTGGVVCVLVCGIGIYMVYRASRDMKKLHTEK